MADHDGAADTDRRERRGEGVRLDGWIGVAVVAAARIAVAGAVDEEKTGPALQGRPEGDERVDQGGDGAVQEDDGGQTVGGVRIRRPAVGGQTVGVQVDEVDAPSVRLDETAGRRMAGLDPRHQDARRGGRQGGGRDGDGERGAEGESDHA
jgi:hypothetical protein